MPGRYASAARVAFQVLGTAYVDVGELVVGDGEGAGGHRVEVLHAVLGVHLQQARPAQRPVDVDGAADAGDAVLGECDDGASLGAGVGQQRGDGPVQVGGGPVGAGVVGAVALEVVVEVGQVAEREVGGAGGDDRAGVASMIHWEETRSAPGPQKWKRGNVPSLSVSSSCRAGGRV
ncbi:hypothetical protein SMICM17S_01944 [Streptomyces microflavus]